MPQEKAKVHKLSAVPNREGAGFAVDFAKESEVCPKCYDTGMEIVVGKGARICSCRKLKATSDESVLAGFPKRYSQCTFENYHVNNSSQRDASRFAFILATQYPAVNQGLLLMGSVGVGKTHLAVSALKVLKDRGFSCLFFEFGSLLKKIQDSYNPNTLTSELSVLNPVLNVEVLVLDELGASKPTDWVRDTLYQIINTRYNEDRITIFTTNFLDERSDHKGEILEDRVGVSIRSRLYQMCKTVVIKGDDYRRHSDRPSAAKKTETRQ